MAKKRSGSRRRKHNPFGGSHKRRRHNVHHRRRRNPDLPLASNAIAPTVLGAAGGGIGASVIPGMVGLGGGWMGILGSGAVAILGAMALKRWPNFSIGWFIGGLTATLSKASQQLVGREFAQFTSPISMGSYYKSGYVPLPAITTDRPLLPGPVAVRAGSPNGAASVTRGVGWNPRFSSRFAA
jgi:hypothetical protein